VSPAGVVLVTGVTETSSAGLPSRAGRPTPDRSAPARCTWSRIWRWGRRSRRFSRDGNARGWT